MPALEDTGSLSQQHACMQELNRAFKDAGMREKGIDDFRLIDLEDPVDISGRLCIIDCKEGKPQRWTTLSFIPFLVFKTHSDRYRRSPLQA